VAVATTGWIVDDRSADFLGLAREIGVTNIKVTRTSFSSSRFPGLRYYDRGYVKEGVAMGGALYIASLRGLPVLELVEREYEELVRP
jgi:NaMN:DMB phosphoribosyltransferase